MQRLIISGLSMLLALAVATPAPAFGKEIALNPTDCDSIAPLRTTEGSIVQRLEALQLCNQQTLLKQQQAMMSEMEAMMAQMKLMMTQMKSMTSSQSGMSRP